MPELLLHDGRQVVYQIRESKRSRRVRLTINPRDGVVMVTPAGVSEATLHELALEWREWIAKQLDAFEMDADALSEAPDIPAFIELAALAQRWHVMERFTPGRAARVTTRKGGTLVLAHGGDAEEACAALRRWLARHAREYLPGMLDEVSQSTGLDYGAVSVRAQRSRWGSCSHRKDISLNQQLLFLPPEWVRHILIHELCHTLELNHSERFWAHVERHDPRWRTTRRELRQGWNHVPRWALG